MNEDIEEALYGEGKLVMGTQGLQLDHSTDRDEDWTPDGIPDSWLDDRGIRHAVVWEEGIDAYMRLKKVGDKWVLNEEAPF